MTRRTEPRSELRRLNIAIKAMPPEERHHLVREAAAVFGEPIAQMLATRLKLVAPPPRPPRRARPSRPRKPRKG